jgi:uncharacterized membrane protein YeiH
MDKLNSLYNFLDLAGTFVFAISGATAARQRGLDLFGVCALAFMVSCGGGIIRDLCIGAIPPTGLTDWRYVVTALIATCLTLGLFHIVQRMNRPVLFFDAIGLAIFAVTGADKALSYGHNGLVAILLGTTTAVGGGVLRDILLNRVPVILEREIYALAALLATLIVVLGTQFRWMPVEFLSVIALLASAALRLLALHFHWNLPTWSNKHDKKND